MDQPQRSNSIIGRIRRMLQNLLFNHFPKISAKHLQPQLPLGDTPNASRNIRVIHETVLRHQYYLTKRSKIIHELLRRANYGSSSKESRNVSTFEIINLTCNNLSSSWMLNSEPTSHASFKKWFIYFSHSSDFVDPLRSSEHSTKS